MPIPASQFVNVIPGVLGAGAPPLSMAGLLILESDQSIPVGTVQPFPSAAAVASWFGPSSNQAYLASIYFQGYVDCTQLPGQLLMAQWNQASVAAWVAGASLAAVSLATLQTYAGTISIRVNGTPYATAGINLSSATSFTVGAGLINSAFIAAGIPAVVTWDALRQRFVITTTATGSAATIAYPTDASLSPLLLLLQTSGAAISQGANAQTPAGLMNAITAVNSNWASFTTDGIPSLSNMEAFASWVTAQNQQFLYVAYDNNAAALTPNATTTFGYITSTYNGVYAIYNPAGDKAAFVMGTIASINFNALNGRINFAYRQSPAALTPDITNQSYYQALVSNFYDSYVLVGSGASLLQWLQNGHVSGNWLWLDSFINQIYFNAAFQSALLAFLASINRVPFTNAGAALLTAALQGTINQMLEFGAAVAGGTLSPAQAAQVNAATGVNAAAAIQNYGYYLSIVVPAPAVQQARGPWPIILYYFDGESVNSISMASIDVE